VNNRTENGGAVVRSFIVVLLCAALVGGCDEFPEYTGAETDTGADAETGDVQRDPGGPGDGGGGEDAGPDVRVDVGSDAGPGDTGPDVVEDVPDDVMEDMDGADGEPPDTTDTNGDADADAQEFQFPEMLFQGPWLIGYSVRGGPQRFSWVFFRYSPRPEFDLYEIIDPGVDINSPYFGCEAEGTFETFSRQRIVVMDLGGCAGPETAELRFGTPLTPTWPANAIIGVDIEEMVTAKRLVGYLFPEDHCENECPDPFRQE